MNNEITSYENGIDFDVEPLKGPNVTIVDVDNHDSTEGQLFYCDDGQALLGGDSGAVWYDEADVLDERIRQMEQLVATACSDGHYNFDEYLYGMANGMILALAIMKDEEPMYLDRPSEWLCDTISSTEQPLGAAGEYGSQPEQCNESEQWVGECDEERCVSDEGWAMLGEIFNSEPPAETEPDPEPYRTIDDEIIAELKVVAEEITLTDYERAMTGL